MPTRRSVTLCSYVTRELGRRIVAGEYAAGQVLPTEAMLCRALQVSRTTLREAMKRLHGKGLVAGGPRSGTRVLPAVQWNQLDAEVLGWRVDHGIDAGLVDQLYEVRHCFEPRACELAALRGTAADHAVIGAAFADIADEGLATDRRIAADLEFHEAIFAATHNIFLVSLGAAIGTALQLSFSLSQTRKPMPGLEVSLHRAVCEAILAGDASSAERAMRDLLAESRHTLERTLHEAVRAPEEMPT